MILSLPLSHVLENHPLYEPQHSHMLHQEETNADESDQPMEKESSFNSRLNHICRRIG